LNGNAAAFCPTLDRHELFLLHFHPSFLFSWQ
jgi:hypothetical protein